MILVDKVCGKKSDDFCTFICYVASLEAEVLRLREKSWLLDELLQKALRFVSDHAIPMWISEAEQIVQGHEQVAAEILSVKETKDLFERYG